MVTLPLRFEDVDHLEQVMSTPSPALVAGLAQVPGDIMVLGVGGKMGPTLARMAKRAAPAKRIIGVARFSEAGLRERLHAQDVECIAADLLSREALAALPDASGASFQRIVLVLALCITFAVVLVGHGLPSWAAGALFVTVAILSLQHAQRVASGLKLGLRTVFTAALIGLGAGTTITLVFQEIFLVRLP